MKYKYINNLTPQDQEFQDILDGESFSNNMSFPERLIEFIEKNKDFQLDYLFICHSSSRYTSYRTVNPLGFIMKKLTAYSDSDFDKAITALAPIITDNLFSKKDLFEISDEDLVKIQSNSEKPRHFERNKKHLLSTNYEKIFHLFTNNFTDRTDHEHCDSHLEVQRFVKNFQLLFNNEYRKSLIEMNFLSNDRFYKLLQFDKGKAFEYSDVIINALYNEDEDKEKAYHQIFSFMHSAKEYNFAKKYHINYTDYIEKIKEMPFFSYDKVPGQGNPQSFILDLYTRGSQQEFYRLKAQPEIYKLLKKDFNEVFLEKISDYIFSDIAYAQGVPMTSKIREKMLKNLKEEMLTEFNIKMFEESYGVDIMDAIQNKYKSSKRNTYITQRLYKITNFYNENKDKIFARCVEEEKSELTKTIVINVSAKNTARI